MFWNQISDKSVSMFYLREETKIEVTTETVWKTRNHKEKNRKYSGYTWVFTEDGSCKRESKFTKR